MNITNYYCYFKNENLNSSRYFKLVEGGNIENINSNGHRNETHWKFENNSLILLDENMKETSHLTLNENLSANYGSQYIFFSGVGNLVNVKLSLICAQKLSVLNINCTKFRMNDMIQKGRS